MLTQSTLTDIGSFLIVFYVSLLSSLIFVPTTKKIARALGVIDHPDSRKVHRSPLPRLGGIGIAGASILTILLCINASQQIVAFLFGAVIITFTGVLDDILSISPKLKFLGQILAVTVFIWADGGHLYYLGDLFGFGNIFLGPLAWVVTVFGMVGVINSLNLSDGLDGLAGGISVVALLFLGMLAYAQQSWFVVFIILTTLGAILGFLRHNSHPATLFMGDTGSLFIGYTLAAVTVGLAHGWNAEPVKPVILAVILAMPIVDTLWVMGNRICQGKKPFHPDRTHIHHRLLGLGLKHGDVVTIIYGLMFSFGMFAWIGREWKEWVLFWAAVGILVLIYWGIGWCERNQVNLGQVLLHKVNRSKARNPFKIRMIKITGKSIRIVFPVFLLFFFAPMVFMGSPPGIIGYFALAGVLFIILLYPWRGGRKEMPMAHGVFFCCHLYDGLALLV
jgi:UDP-GlcNAc:undecaprenyl-phosphate GlcNAc-1-phosphate transferase